MQSYAGRHELRRKACATPPFLANLNAARMAGGNIFCPRTSAGRRRIVMIALVRLALRRPYTMAIAAMLILLMGGLAVTRVVVDIFPSIDIPVVYVAWNYPGLSAEDMERRVVLISERAYSTTVNGIERIESLSIPGVGILKIYFQPGSDIGGAIAQISAQNNAILRIAPPGIT